MTTPTIRGHWVADMANECGDQETIERQARQQTDFDAARDIVRGIEVDEYAQAKGEI